MKIFMIKFQNKQVISVQDWDDLVVNTYGRPYSFQQQDGCKDRGNVSITIPSSADDYEKDTIPEKINGSQMGVSFKAWLARDPNEWSVKPQQDYHLDLFWSRNFYPNVQMVANDLHAKGLIPAGNYDIEIDW
jgi:hypothetical protein